MQLDPKTSSAKPQLNSDHMWRRWLTTYRTELIAALLLLVVSLLFFWRVPVLGYVLLPLDNLYTFEPWRSEVYGANAIPLWNPATTDGVRSFYPLAKITSEFWLRGEIPFWNPYALTGMPILAAGSFQALYPVANLLRLTLPVAQAVSWSVILHFFLGCLFTFMFMRELGSGLLGAVVAALAFVFNGAIMIWLTFPAVIETIFWLPLILWGWERALRRNQWGWLGVSLFAVTMQILAGQFQVAYYSATGVGFYALYRAGVDGWQQRRWPPFFRPLAYLFAVYGLAALLSAFQVLPFLELTTQGARGDEVYQFDPVALSLFRLLVPDFFGTQLDGFITEGYKFSLVLYFGIAPLIFLGVSLLSPARLQTWGFFGIGLLVLLVVYQIPPFHQLFSIAYPTYNILGFDRALFLTAFFWAVAAGLGLDWVVSARPGIIERTFLPAAWLLWGAATAAALIYAFWAKYQPRHFWNLPEIATTIPPEYRLASLLFFIFFSGASLLLLSAWFHKRLSAKIFGGLTVLLVTADLFLANIDYFPAYPAEMLFPVTPSLAFLQQQVSTETQPYRIAGMERVLWSDMAGVFHLPDVQGYDSFITRRYSHYINASGIRDDTNYRIAAFRAKTSKFLDALNVKYFYAPRHKLTDGDWVSLLSQVQPPQVESPYDYAGQPAEWNVGGWPQPALLAPTPAKITFAGRLDFPTQIETALALSPEQWANPAADVLFEVTVQSAAAPQPQPLFSQRLTARDAAAQTWQPALIDLSAFTGQEVLVSFHTTATDPAAKWDAAWANPLLSDSSKMELLHYGPNSIYLNKNHLPRAWLVHQAVEVAPEDTAAAAALLSQPGFDPAAAAVIEGSLPAPLAQPDAPATVKFVSYGPSASTIAVNTAAPGLLVVSDIYYPGWNAYVDGLPQPLYAANIAMRGVYVPAGNHTVTLKYEPQLFRVGLIISAATLLLLLAVTVGRRWRSKKQKLQE